MSALVDIAVTDTFIAALKRDSFLPAVQSQFSDQDLLDIAYEQFLRRMAPVMLRARPTFFRESYDITLVGGQSSYNIPPFAMLNKLQVAQLIGVNGEVGKLNRRDPAEDVYFYQTSASHALWIRLHDKTIEINPTPSSGDVNAWPTLRCWIYRRPGRFVRLTDDGSGNNPARAAQVIANDGNGTLTYNTIMPSSFNASSEHDIYDQTSPYPRIVTDKFAIAAPSTSSQTFTTTDLPSTVGVGDYVCLTNETCVLPVPVEFIPHLKDLVIKSIAKTQGAQDDYALALKEMESDIVSTFSAAADPMEGNPQTITLLQSPFLSAMRRGRTIVRS